MRARFTDGGELLFNGVFVRSVGVLRLCECVILVIRLQIYTMILTQQVHTTHVCASFTHFGNVILVLPSECNV
jgi:hypothetical protein